MFPAALDEITSPSAANARAPGGIALMCGPKPRLGWPVFKFQPSSRPLDMPATRLSPSGLTQIAVGETATESVLMIWELDIRLAAFTRSQILIAGPFSTGPS